MTSYLLLKNKYSLLLLICLLFSVKSFCQFPYYYQYQPYDSTSRKMQLIYAPKNPELAMYGGIVRFKHYVLVEGKKLNYNRKSLNPYFRQVPDAYKSWNKGYVFSYCAVAAFAGAIVFQGLEIKQITAVNGHVGNIFLYLGASLTSLIAGEVFAIVGRNKKRNAFVIYNHHIEK